MENGDDIVVNLSVNPITFKTDSTLIYSEGRYTKDSSLQRFFTTLNPKFIFRKPAWKMKFELGGKVTFINEEPEFLPDIYLSRKLYKTHVVYYSGWKGKIISNSYKQLMEKNPFITPVMPIKYSMSLNSYTGVKGHFADNFFYQLEFAYKNITNKPYFVNDSLDRKNFDVVYDGRTAILDFHAQLGYHLEDKAKVALQSHYKNYDLTDLEKPWHAPQFKLSLSGHYNIQDKIRLKADIFAWDKIYARVDGESQRLPFIFDANLQAQYRYLDNLSFFINLENLLGRYSRWYGYPNYGFHLIAGGILRF